jgi:hypothetical protein
MSRRRNKSRRLILIGCLVLLAGAGIAVAIILHSAAPPSALYTLRLGAERKVGLVTDVKVQGSYVEDITDTQNGEKTASKHKEFRFELSGTRKILRIDFQGRVTQFSFTIERCVKVTGDGPVDAAPRGLEVCVSMDPDSKTRNYSVPKPCDHLSDDAKRIFAFFTHREIDPIQTDEQGLALAIPRQIGETWSIKPGSFGDGTILEPRVLVPAMVRGQVTLKGQCSNEGVDCLEIGADITSSFQGVNVVDRTLQTYNMKTSPTYFVPRDPSIPCPKATVKEECSIQNDLQVKDVHLHVDLHSESVRTITETLVK